MRRPVLASLAALLGVLSLAAPAGAGGTTDIIVGAPDGSFVVESVPTATVDAALRRARQRPDVAWAEVDRTFSVAAVTPNDPEYPSQWGPPRVRAPEAWSRSTGDSSVVVAVVDTGVDATHPDLAGAVLPGQDFVGDGLTGDPGGHGTAVAGVVAARGNNGQGIAGYCWACKILPVRVLDAEGNGNSGDIANGITWAANHGADIINLSLAGERTSITLEMAIAAARAKGILVVAAAGNKDGSKPTQDLTVPQYPAASEGVVGVVATTVTDTAYPWTFRGPWADVAAPGCVVSTRAGGGYTDQCGTSFASPAVAGILGLALAGFPQAPVATAESTMLSTAVPVAGGIVGRGRVDAAAFLDAMAAAFPSPTLQPQRVAGVNRIATSVALSKKAFNGADTVILARADTYTDALLAAPLAGRFRAPVLLSGAGGLDPLVSAEVKRLGATTAYLIGGQDALGAGVESGLKAVGVANLPRLAGPTPFDTARVIAAQLGSQKAYVAQIAGWPDAVSVSTLAAMTQTPVLLVERDRIPAATAQALASLQIKDVTIVGGTSVVSAGVEAALAAPGRTVKRLFGATRYDTSRVIAGAIVEAGGDNRRTWVATGGNWPDALAAGPAAAAQGAVLLLVDGTNAAGTPAVTLWLQGLAGTLRELVIVGGEASVTGPTVTKLASLVG